MANMLRLFSKPVNLVQLGERSLHLTTPVYSTPLRKKKVANPLTTKKQFERKLRRLEREINKLESIDPKLKPILELQLPPQVKKDLDSRKRKEDDQVSHNLLNSYLKVWSIYRTIETQAELHHIRNAASAQEKALSVLKQDYPHLYKAAIEIDPTLLPFTVVTVKKDTPPVDSYACPDGKEFDITKEWKL